MRSVSSPDAILRAEQRSQLADPDRVRALSLRAVDAAKQAGAAYADVRVTRTVSETFVPRKLTNDFESLAIGVRALVNGAWGFSASPYWDLDEAEQLAKAAVAQAKINARLNTRSVEMGHYPAASGSWRMPVRIDPFQIPLEEKFDFMHSFQGLFPTRVRGRHISGLIEEMYFTRQERAVATTEGAYFTQIEFMSGGSFAVYVGATDKTALRSQVRVAGKGTTRSGTGWELFLDAKLREQIPQLIAEAEATLMRPVKPVDVGRYDLVCDATTMAALLDGTLGPATELDRTLGYEANAGGVSYLGPDPLANLGTALGPSFLNVTADRSMEKGIATTKWDDEGVTPDTFPIVQHGVLVDYTTMREQTNWLHDWYTSRQRPVRSHGCARASSAINMVQSFTPNLTLAPGSDDVGFDDLVANTKRGIALIGCKARMDFQSRTGACTGGTFREITNGKLGVEIGGAGVLFDSTELWKKLTALGGASTRELSSASETKGQPSDSVSYSVATVPGSFQELAVIDVRRKA
jgi:TldD protein